MPNRLKSFWKELKRRRVIRVLLWYAGVGIVLIELAINISEPLNFPDWTPRLVILLVSIGVPVAAIISWIFDITPEGIIKTDPLDIPKQGMARSLVADMDSEYDGSIAVLPFQDMSPQKDQEYFCDGISEEIINALTRVERLKVISRTSAFAFKGHLMDIREIGHALNVANVLEGSIRKDGTNLRITSQLIRVEDGSHLWSETYNRELKDIFSIQEEISMAIVDKLKMSLRGGARGGIGKRYTQNPEAFQFYLKGLYYYSMMTPDGNQKAQECYRKAIDMDPNYTLVYAILGSNHLFAGLQGFVPPSVAVKYAREHTEKALKLDDKIPVAHSTLGGISLLYDWDLKGSEKDFLKSVQLNPNTAWDRFFYAWYLRSIGNYDEAIAETLIALEKDPFNILIGTELGKTFLLAGRVEQAIERQQKTISIYPNGFMAHLHLGEALEVKGQLTKAISSYEKAVSLSNGAPMTVAALANAMYKSGKTNEAQERINMVEQMKEAVYVPSALFITFYLLKKDLDKAYGWLKIACEERDFLLPSLMNNPIIEYRIPDEPRFITLLEQTGLNAFQRKYD